MSTSFFLVSPHSFAVCNGGNFPRLYFFHYFRGETLPACIVENFPAYNLAVSIFHLELKPCHSSNTDCHSNRHLFQFLGGSASAAFASPLDTYYTLSRFNVNTFLKVFLIFFLESFSNSVRFLFDFFDLFLFLFLILFSILCSFFFVGFDSQCLPVLIPRVCSMQVLHL